MDIVLTKPDTKSVRFCYSSYMNQKFEMVLMDKGLLVDESMQNSCISISDDEFDRCIAYMQALVDGHTNYGYLDAMLLMPVRFPSMLRSDVQPHCVPRSIFCSQSAMLMLRDCLDKEGRHQVFTCCPSYFFLF
jgi:hypothetical protein